MYYQNTKSHCGKIILSPQREFLYGWYGIFIFSQPPADHPIIKMMFTNTGISIIKIRQFHDFVIFLMGLPKRWKTILLLEQELCNIESPYEMHLKPKSHEISFARNLFDIYPIVWKFGTKFDSITAMLKTIGQLKRMS